MHAGIAPHAGRAGHDMPSPCGNITTSPANSCTAASPRMPAQQLPAAIAWYSITCSTPGIRSGPISLAVGASAAQAPLPLTWKNTAPRSRTARSTSDSVSWLIAGSIRMFGQAGRTLGQPLHLHTRDKGRASKYRGIPVKRRTARIRRMTARVLRRVHSFRSSRSRRHRPAGVPYNRSHCARHRTEAHPRRGERAASSASMKRRK